MRWKPLGGFLVVTGVIAMLFGGVKVLNDLSIGVRGGKGELIALVIGLACAIIGLLLILDGGSARGRALVADPPPGPPAGWYRDPHGRHAERYWDGSGWTDFVLEDGVPIIDPPFS